MTLPIQQVRTGIRKGEKCFRLMTIHGLGLVAEAFCENPKKKLKLLDAVSLRGSFWRVSPNGTATGREKAASRR